MNDQQEHEEDLRVSGLSGGGTGRKDEVGGSVIDPASGPYPTGHAEIREQASWGQGERVAAGYEDHGGSGLSYRVGQVLAGYDAESRSQQKLTVQIPSGEITLAADLGLPQELRGVVLFAHGSGSGRHSPRNQYVAGVLQDAGIATL